MEEPKSVPVVPNPSSNSTTEQNPTVSSSTQAQVPSTATTGLPPLHPQISKKRKIDRNVEIQNSKYFKIGSIVKDLRPHFIEVLRTPDFQDSKPAHEILKQMNLLMDIYRQIMAENVTMEKCTKPVGDKSVPGESNAEASEQDPKSVNVPEKPKQGEPSQSVKSQPVQIPEPSDLPSTLKNGSYVIGGSNLGWNFISWMGGKAVYYGVTKEAWRAKNGFNKGIQGGMINKLKRLSAAEHALDRVLTANVLSKLTS